MPMLVLRQLLIYAHTLAFAFAIVAVLREDLALLRSPRIDAARLGATCRQVVWWLALLWATGGALVAMEIGFDWSQLATRPKLGVKLTVVFVLTINGVLLHRVAFPMLTTPQRSPRFAAATCAALGSIGTATWLYASFVGVGRLIAPAIGYSEWMKIYLAVLLAGLAVALVFVRPRLERRLSALPDARASGSEVIAFEAARHARRA